MSGRSVSFTGRPLPTGALIKSNRSASLYTVNLSDGSASNSVKEMHGRTSWRPSPCPSHFHLRRYDDHENGHDTAFAHSANSRKKVAAVMLPCPGNRIPPARFSWLCNNAIVHLEREILLCLKRSNGLEASYEVKTYDTPGGTRDVPSSQGGAWQRWGR